METERPTRLVDNEQYRRLAESKNRLAEENMSEIREMALNIAARLEHHGDVNQLLKAARQIEEYLLKS